jgi:hypothetical protein
MASKRLITLHQGSLASIEQAIVTGARIRSAPAVDGSLPDDAGPYVSRKLRGPNGRRIRASRWADDLLTTSHPWISEGSAGSSPPRSLIVAGTGTRALAQSEAHHHEPAPPAPAAWTWTWGANVFVGWNYQVREFTDFDAVESQNWFIGRRRAPAARRTLPMHSMISLEPFTVRDLGSPQVFQTGETYQQVPLIDYQHPHDLFRIWAPTGRVTRAPGVCSSWRPQSVHRRSVRPHSCTASLPRTIPLRRSRTISSMRRTSRTAW